MGDLHFWMQILRCSPRFFSLRSIHPFPFGNEQIDSFLIGKFCNLDHSENDSLWGITLSCIIHKMIILEALLYNHQWEKCRILFPLILGAASRFQHPPLVGHAISLWIGHKLYGAGKTEVVHFGEFAKLRGIQGKPDSKNVWCFPMVLLQKDNPVQKGEPAPARHGANVSMAGKGSS